MVNYRGYPKSSELPRKVQDELDKWPHAYSTDPKTGEQVIEELSREGIKPVRIQKEPTVQELRKLLFEK